MLSEGLFILIYSPWYLILILATAGLPKIVCCWMVTPASCLFLSRGSGPQVLFSWRQSSSGHCCSTFQWVKSEVFVFPCIVQILHNIVVRYFFLFQVFIVYFKPGVFRCIALRWVRVLGFCIVYGTIILKLYRWAMLNVLL